MYHLFFEVYSWNFPIKSILLEFKQEVIDYFLNSPKSVTQICKEFGISPSQFYVWKKKLLGDAVNDRAGGEGEHGGSEEASPAQLAAEIRKLRQELANAHRREEILKKAPLILGNDLHNNMS